MLNKMLKFTDLPQVFFNLFTPNFNDMPMSSGSRAVRHTKQKGERYG
jgi:hypothetical protein